MENNKKKKYIIGGVVLTLLIYFNYFGEEKKVEKKERVVETVGVTYTDAEYVIDAGKQFDYLDKEETTFENAKAKIKDMILTGNNAFLDKARNLVLKSNILGISPNGWNFTANDINYDRTLGKIVSKTGVKAENKERGVAISGQEFYTDSKMSFIDLYKNVTIEGAKFNIVGDEGHYQDSDKIAILKENIKLVVKNADEKLTKEITGSFKRLDYDVKNQIITGDTDYTLNYDEAVLNANKFIYNQKNESATISGNVKLKAGGFDIDVEKIEKVPNKQEVNIVGQIKGQSPERSFVADNGIYYMDTKELVLYGNISMKGLNGENLVADKIVYNSQTEDITAYGEKQEVIYNTGKEEFRSKKVIYNDKTKILVVNDKFKFKNKTYDGTGTSLVYNDLTKEGEFYGIVANSSSSIIETPKVIYKGQAGDVFFPLDYKVTQKSSGGVFNSKNAKYNELSKMFTSEEEFNYASKGDIVTGKGISYNTDTGTGEILSKVKMLNEVKGTRVEGDKGEIKDGNLLTLSGNVLIESKEYSTKVSKVDYTMNDKLVKINEAVKIKSFDGKTEINMVNPIIDTEKQILTGDNFVGFNEEYNGKSEKAEYRYGEEKLILIKNAKLEQKDMVLTGNRIEYSLKTGKAEAKGPYTAKNSEWTLNGIDLYIINSTGEVKGGKVDANSVNKESFQGDRVEGNLNTTVDFIGNAHGKTYDSTGKLVTYTGDIVKVHFKKNPKGSGYQAKQIDLLENSIIKNENSTLYSDKIYIDLEKNIATAYNRPKGVSKDAKNGDTEVLANRMEFYIDKDLIKLYEDVVVTNVDTKNEKTVGKGNNGLAKTKEKFVELEGDVVIDSPDAILYADRAEYNMITKKVKAFGDKVKVDYKKK